MRSSGYPERVDLTRTPLTCMPAITICCPDARNSTLCLRSDPASKSVTTCFSTRLLTRTKTAQLEEFSRFLTGTFDAAQASLTVSTLPISLMHSRPRFADSLSSSHANLMSISKAQTSPVTRQRPAPGHVDHSKTSDAFGSYVSHAGRSNHRPAA